MFLGRVIGEVWSTRKAPGLEGLRLLVVQPLDDARDPAAPMVTPVVCADRIGADQGEIVVAAFGKAARVATLGQDGEEPFEAAVVGIVDDFDVPSAPPSWRENASAFALQENAPAKGAKS